MGRWHIQFGYIGQRDDLVPGGIEQEGSGFHYTTQSDMQFKTFESVQSFPFNIFRLQSTVGD